MFDKFEALTCSKCDTSFTGRKPSEEGADVFCFECLKAKALPVVDHETKTIPKTVNDEFKKGGGENGKR